MLLRRSMLILGFAFVLSACGFKLKGFYDVPESLQQLVFAENSGSPTALGRALTAQLQTNGVVLSESAPYRLVLEPAEYNRRAITLNASADAEEYELNGRAKFAVYRGAETAPILERTVSALRTYAENTNTNALGTLESRYRDEINQRMAEQIIRQYLRIAPGQ